MTVRLTPRYMPSYLRHTRAWVIIDRLEHGYCRLPDTTGTLQELRFPTEENTNLWLTWACTAGALMNIAEPDPGTWPPRRREAV